MKKECILLDVFTNIPYTGNQLAVFPFADELSEGQMQKLANEINYSETVFLLTSSDSNADYDIRIFTPKSEIPFAGHPTLGAAYSILNVFDNNFKRKNSVRLRTKVGVIPLEQVNDTIWMKQNAPQFYDLFEDRARIADLVRLKESDISENLPVQEVSTGNAMLLVPVKKLLAIRKAKGDLDKIKEFFSKTRSIAPYLFTLETEDAKASVHTRLFAPHLGVVEDPATGSAAGPLAAYLLKHNVFGQKFEIQNEQGVEMGRASKIIMKGTKECGQYSIEIGGACCFIGQSIFQL